MATQLSARMRRFCSAAAGLALVFGFGAGALADQEAADAVVAEAPQSAWRQIDPENTLYLELKDGMVVIEMRPDFAPAHVERLKTLARANFYDGVVFHRVIDGFMAQGGDPTGTGAGASDLPDLQAEFHILTETDFPVTVLGRDEYAAQVGFTRGMPVASQAEMVRAVRSDKKVKTWLAHCPGMTSMARANDPNSANSQFFLMLGDTRRALDETYTPWGRIVLGYEHVQEIAIGEPPPRPDKIISMRVGSDVPVEERLTVEVMRTNSDAFADYVGALGVVSDGRVRTLCDIDTPTRLVAQ